MCFWNKHKNTKQVRCPPSYCFLVTFSLICQKGITHSLNDTSLVWPKREKKKKNKKKSVNKCSQTWCSQRLKSQRSQSYLAAPSLVVMAWEGASQRACPLLCFSMREKFFCSNLGITFLFLGLQNKERHVKVLPDLSTRDAQDPEVYSTMS